MSQERPIKTRLEEAREFMEDFALPPGLGIGVSDAGTLVAIKEATSEVVGFDVGEEEVGSLAIELWREYLSDAPDAVVARFVQCVLAVDSMLEHTGDLRFSPEAEDARRYECTLRHPDSDAIEYCRRVHS